MKVRKNWCFISVSIISIFSVLWMPFKRARIRLADILKNQLGYYITIQFTKSGRSALFILSNHLKSLGYGTAIIPYRLCNVVDMAIRKADMDIFTYKNDKDLELLITDLSLFKNKIPVLLIATYFNYRINNIKIADIFLKQFGKDAPIIFDECQSLFDFSLFMKYKSLENKFMLLSFNDKYIPGVMGGAIINKGDLNFAIKKMQSKQELFFSLFFLKNILDFIFRRIQFNTKGEFSSCRGFFYEIDNYDISYISTIVTLGFLRFQDMLRKRFSKNYQIINKVSSHSSEFKIYHLINKNVILNINNLPTKGPYLIREDEPLVEAIDETGGIFLINSFKYKYSE